MSRFERNIYRVTLEITFPVKENEYIVQCRDGDGNILGGDGAVLCGNILEVVKMVEGTRKMLNEMPRKESKNDEIRASQG